MIKKITFIFLVFNCSLLFSQTKQIGSNISEVVDYGTEILFVNVFNQSREWISFDDGGEWDSGVSIPLRPDGYPLEIPYDDDINPLQYVRSLTFIAMDGYYPSGGYRLIVEGSGQITFSGSISGTYTCPVDEVVTVDNVGGGIYLEIDNSAVSDPIHGIKLILPGSHTDYDTNPFNPLFTDFISDFETIRFMDFMNTNSSAVVTWSDRTPFEYYTQSKENGVSYEWLIKLCNSTQKDAWVCIPHQADDSFVSEFANLLRDSLDASLKIYVEYSNEVWNGIFEQAAYAENMGDILGYPGEPWEQGWTYYAKRCADIHTIFETAFVDDDRIINVVASQTVGYVSNFILDQYESITYNPSQVEAEALAIAPYFGGGLADAIGDAGLADLITVDDILDSLEFASLPESFYYMDAIKLVADDHDLSLIAYEGGQHLVSYAYSDNMNFVDTLIAVNRHPRMQDLYCDYFNYWFETIGGGLFCHFTSHGLPGPYGSWGVKEHFADTLSPKYLALKACIFDHNTLLSIAVKNDVPTNNFFNVFPNPTSGITNIGTTINGINQVIIYNSQGKACYTSRFDKALQINVSSFDRGLYFINLITENEEVEVKKLVIY